MGEDGTSIFDQEEQGTDSKDTWIQLPTVRIPLGIKDL